MGIFFDISGVSAEGRRYLTTYDPMKTCLSSAKRVMLCLTLLLPILQMRALTITDVAVNQTGASTFSVTVGIYHTQLAIYNSYELTNEGAGTTLKLCFLDTPFDAITDTEQTFDLTLDPADVVSLRVELYVRSDESAPCDFTTPVDAVDISFSVPMEAPLVLSVDSRTEPEWQVFPIPSKGALYFSRSTEGIQLTDLTGREVYAMKGTLFQLDLSGLPDGIYLMQATVDGRAVSRKIVIRR